MKLSEILRAGKQRIETHGWCQGDEQAIWASPDAYGNRKCCAATAISNGVEGRDFPKVEAACEFLRRSIGLSPEIGLAIWNDAPGRTVEDVLAAYDKAIAAAEAQEQANA